MGRWLIFPLLIKELRSIKYLFQDKTAPLKYKAAVVLGLIYLFSPVDLIPAPILGFGILDDLTIWGCLLYYLKDPLSKYGKEFEDKKKNPTKGKQVIEDVTYTVVTDEDKKKETDK